MKLHLACGDVYLKDYINIDIVGFLISPDRTKAVNIQYLNACFLHKDMKVLIDLSEGNPNETTLDNYFKYPFIQDEKERAKIKRDFIIDKQMNILEAWPFKDKSVEDIVMISCIEHFNPKTELPHILSEINRVMKKEGRLIIDFPDIKKQVAEYYDKDPEFCMELIYCNHKNSYSIHHWGFNEKTFPKYLGKNWEYTFETVVKHEYPMIGVIAIKKD